MTNAQLGMVLVAGTVWIMTISGVFVWGEYLVHIRSTSEEERRKPGALEKLSERISGSDGRSNGTETRM